MFKLIYYGSKLLTTIRDHLVPFLTEPPDSMVVYNVFTGTAETYPWAFGDITIAELLFGAGLIGILGYRLVKFFLDIIF